VRSDPGLPSKMTQARSWMGRKTQFKSCGGGLSSAHAPA